MVDGELLGGILFVAGMALALAIISEANDRWRGLAWGPRHLLSRADYRWGLAAAAGCLSLGGLLAARVIWARLAWGAALAAYAVAWAYFLRCPLAAGPNGAYLYIPAEPTPSATRRAGRTGVRAVALVWAECALVALVAPALWVPSLRPDLTALALMALPIYWLLGALLDEPLWPHARYNLALAVLLAALAAGAWRSGEPALTTPKVASLILGAALYRALLRLARGPRSLGAALAAIVALALLFTAVGLTNGIRANKVEAVGGWLGRLPRLVQELPDAQFGQASMNQLGGALLYVWPLTLAVAIAPAPQRGSCWPVTPGVRWLAAGAAMVLGAALLLAQSRGAWVGALAGLLCLAALRWTWGRWAALAIVMLGGLAWLFGGRASWGPLVAEALFGAQGPQTAWGQVSLSGRLEIWARAIGYIRASPWLGGGWGTFRLWDAALASRAARSIFDAGTPHAHNIFLQIAYDAGLPGLAAYLALLMVQIRLSWRVYRHGRGALRALALGKLAAIAAHHIYGLTDVVALGSKPGVLWWAVLALSASLHRLSFTHRSR